VVDRSTCHGTMTRIADVRSESGLRSGVGRTNERPSSADFLDDSEIKAP